MDSIFILLAHSAKYLLLKLIPYFLNEFRNSRVGIFFLFYTFLYLWLPAQS